MTHPDAQERHKRTAPANALALSGPNEIDGVTIEVDEMWQINTAGDRALIQQITREMRQPLTVSPDSADSSDDRHCHH